MNDEHPNHDGHSSHDEQAPPPAPTHGHGLAYTLIGVFLAALLFRADVAFYERFVGSTAQRHGLTVHELQLQAQQGPAWHFTATLTQNLNRGAVNSGRLTLALEGSRDGKLQRLDWAQLRQQPQAPGVDYSFKYFQQLEGDILLPEGLQPIRVIVRLQPARGAVVEQSFTWAEATTSRPPANG